jgi:hypothetical protein
MASFLNGVRFKPTTAGTDDFTVDEAVQGYQTPVNAGAIDGRTYRYRAESRDLLEWEIGSSVYTSATQTFTRSVLFSSNANAKVNFTRVPDVALVFLAEDAAPLGDFSESVDDRVAALVQNGTNITWTYDDSAGTLTPAITSAALTRVDDTNVTLTLGGAPTTAVLTATSITVGWSGQLALSRGGTNADLSATGGTAQYLKQSSAGAAVTVGTIPASDIQSGQALTKTDDTNVTLTLGGSPTDALLKATSLTLGWTGTLAAARLNANVVQAITNDTNVTGSISAQNLTLGWTGTLAASRGGTGISSLGTGVATALGINVGSAGAFVTFNGALGTPSSGTLTNATGLPIGGLTGLGTGVGTALAVGIGSTGALLTTVKGHIHGLTLSNNTTDATNDIDIAAGEATSTEATPVLMILASALTKRLDAGWAVGTGNGGLDTGSIADTTYHVWLIRRSDTGVVDALFSTSASSPTMPTNYDQKRRIGSIMRASSTIRGFVQYGDQFRWKDPVGDVAATDPGTSAVTRTLSVPAGIIVEAFVTVGFDATSVASNPASVFISDLSATDGAPSVGRYNVLMYSATATFNNAGLVARVFTNTSGQIRSRCQGSAATTVFRIQTHGWWDQRGRDS